MSGYNFNNIKYIQLCNDHNLKFDFALESNVYFTLRDIFVNISDIHHVMTANEFNSQLTNNVYYENRTELFKYTNVLENPEYVSKLYKWLSRIHISDFYFENISGNDDVLTTNELNTKYMKFDLWYTHFEYLINLVKIRLEQIK